MNEEVVRVGVGLLLVKGNQVLLARRKSEYAQGLYGAIGGKVDHMESLEQAIRREMAEECGPQVKIKNLRFLCVINLKHYPPDHYVDVGFVAEWVSGQPTQMEPHKLDKWEWHDMNKLPKPMFAVDPLYVEAYKTGKNYFDF